MRRIALSVVFALALIVVPVAGATTVAKLSKLIGDCHSACGGPRGVGEATPGAFGQAVAVSADGTTALVGTPQARVGNGAAWVFVKHGGSWRQQGQRLVVDCRQACGGPKGTGADGNTFEFGGAVALSASGDTALIGAPGNGERGGAWVFTRSHGRWSQQGPRLIGFCHPDRRTCIGPNGTGLSGYGFGASVALSASGNTALIGAPGGPGGVWVFTHQFGSWRQQAKLVGNCRPSATRTCTGPNGTGQRASADNAYDFGSAVALSADGNTALIGHGNDNSNGVDGAGAAWVFTRTGAGWSQQGPPLSASCTSGCGGPDGAGEIADGAFGSAVALSSDGSTALIGAPRDAHLSGDAFLFTRSAGEWSQGGGAFVGGCTTRCTGQSGTGQIDSSDIGAQFGTSVALTADGTTALIGAPYDLSCTGCHGATSTGAAWLFGERNGDWTQLTPKLVVDCTTAPCTGANGTGELGRLGGQFGAAVAMSGSGSSLLIGAPQDDCVKRCDTSIGNSGEGAAWIFSLTLSG